MSTPTDGPVTASLSPSDFVTVVGWMFLLCSGFAAFVSLGQNIVLSSLPRGIIAQMNSDTAFTRVLPATARFSLTHMRLFAAVILLLSGTTFVASIGLLKRRNWARVAFAFLMCLMVCGALSSLVGLAVQQSMPLVKTPPTLARGPLTPMFQQSLETQRDTMIGVDVGLIVLCVWIIVKLRSPRVRREFSTRGSAA